jgi:ABC-type nitrate/sulfonate/bicarbonate transport system permease component
VKNALIRYAPIAICALAWELVARLGLISSAALPTR